jgi:hypothetical protein
MGTIGDQAPDRPRTERIRCPHGDDHPEPAGARDSPAKSDRLIFLGRDETGALLEVMAIETDRGLLVIHAMTMRAKYRIHLKGDDDANT